MCRFSGVVATGFILRSERIDFYIFVLLRWCCRLYLLPRLSVGLFNCCHLSLQGLAVLAHPRELSPEASQRHNTNSNRRRIRPKEWMNLWWEWGWTGRGVGACWPAEPATAFSNPPQVCTGTFARCTWTTPRTAVSSADRASWPGNTGRVTWTCTPVSRAFSAPTVRSGLPTKEICIDTRRRAHAAEVKTESET